MNRSITLAAAGLAAGISAMTIAAPPTADEIKAKTEAAMTYYRAQGEKFSLEDPGFHAVLDAQLNGINPAECDMETIGNMQMLWAYSPNAKPVWIGRIVEIGQGSDWLDASLMLASMGENDRHSRLPRRTASPKCRMTGSEKCCKRLANSKPNNSFRCRSNSSVSSIECQPMIP